MKNSDGYGSDAVFSVGDVRIRTRHKRGGERRAFVKVSEPNTWALLARVTWEREHGAIPKGFGIHHIDKNTLNDNVENLELVSKQEHLSIHIPECRAKAIANFTKARRRIKWSTKSIDKITGRHPNNCKCPLHSC
jgi:hypothetical protein